MAQKKRIGSKAGFMRRAIRSAKQGMTRLEGGPFGACLVKGRRVLAVTHNTVLRHRDATCHAEINAIRVASRKLKSFDLSGCEIFSTTEPCTMCFSAIHWARISRVHFGTYVGEVKKRGFNELIISSTRMKKLGKSAVRLSAKVLRRECLDLLRAWDRRKIKPVY